MPEHKDILKELEQLETMVKGGDTKATLSYLQRRIREEKETIEDLSGPGWEHASSPGSSEEFPLAIYYQPKDRSLRYSVEAWMRAEASDDEERREVWGELIELLTMGFVDEPANEDSEQSTDDPEELAAQMRAYRAAHPSVGLPEVPAVE